MSRSLNRSELIGNLGQDPDVRYTGQGIAVTTFSIATNESWNDADGNKQERTEWHTIVAWRKLAEICGEHLKKGSKVFVAGRLGYREFDDKNAVHRRVAEITIDEVIFLDGAKREGESS